MPDGWVRPEEVFGLTTEEAEAARDLLPPLAGAGAGAGAGEGADGVVSVRLYDLSADPSETVDLSRERPDAVRVMLDRMDQVGDRHFFFPTKFQHLRPGVRGQP